MPCQYESYPIGQTRPNKWYCCYCVTGPHNVTINLHCPECGHQRCSSLQSERTLNPPELRTRRVQAFVEAASAYPPEIGTGVPIQRSENSHDELYPCNTGERYQYGSSNHTSGPYRLSQHSTAPASQYQQFSNVEAPSGEAPLQPRGNGKDVQIDPNRRRRTSMKRRRAPNTTNVKIQLNNDQSLGDLPDADDYQDPGSIYSCPFFVMNVNRYRFFKNFKCSHPWTMPKLREHILGKSQSERSRNGPHVLHICDQCFEGFTDEDALATHLSGAPCPLTKEYPLPAEGVGRILAEKICQLPKGPKSDKRVKEYEDVWNEWYRVLSGRDAPPKSCYFENAKALADDLMSLEDTKLQLVQTFQRALPIGLKAEALRCYAESYWSAAIDTIRPLVDTSEFEWAYAIITSSVTEPSRRKPRILLPERGSAEPSLEPVTTAYEGGIPSATWYQQSKPWGELADTEMSTMDMDIVSQSILSAEPWTTWPLIEDLNDLDRRYSTAEEPSFPQNVLPETEASATFLSGREDLPFATCNDFDASDILKAVQPELVPHNPQLSLMEEETETLAGDCTEKGAEGKAVRLEVGQPSNSHGVFKQSPFDPFSNPSFITQEPLSHGLVGDEALFSLDDMEGM